MSSSATNYVPNKHEDADQYDSYAIPYKMMSYQSYPKSLVNQNEIPIELIVLTSSSGTNYVPNEHLDVDQYGSFTIPSEVMPC